MSKNSELLKSFFDSINAEISALAVEAGVDPDLFYIRFQGLDLPEKQAVFQQAQKYQKKKSCEIMYLISDQIRKAGNKIAAEQAEKADKLSILDEPQIKNYLSRYEKRGAQAAKNVSLTKNQFLDLKNTIDNITDQQQKEAVQALIDSKTEDN